MLLIKNAHSAIIYQIFIVWDWKSLNCCFYRSRKTTTRSAIIIQTQTGKVHWYISLFPDLYGPNNSFINQENLFGRSAVVLAPARCYREEAETYNEDGALAWVQDSHSLVLAGGENLGAVAVPAGAVDEVGVYAVDPHHWLPTSHVPQDHHVVTACMDTKWHWSTM